ncbi:MAG: UDP-2,3-diacylglucosamine diphosphatase [Brachymonas denitrificans]|uniref:UDP-2,3-diacylglucosamine diphosphatase n=1 Tax=Brachymonas denitrificans TaxID=28220 RepID=UPI001BD19B40|nr:UDP-2,3-diacylglucosamine diphosphatase [Brachymonas denitrificans]
MSDSLSPATPDTALAHVIAPASWRCVDFVSDLHLQQDDATWQAFARYLQQTPADAVFLLGDIFEVWVGDDVTGSAEHGFERAVAAALRTAGATRALYFMHGNRDFLVGQTFCAEAGMTLLQDPCVLEWPQAAGASERILLSHGDALCIDDTQYMQFRAQVRQPAWQQALLQQALEQRLALARQLRAQSESRKNELGVEGYADVDHPLACRWLAEHGCHTLLHGHTHKPAEHVLDASHQPPLRRLVLGDWEMGGHPVRGDVLRWCPGKDQPWDRVPAVSYATGD